MDEGTKKGMNPLVSGMAGVVVGAGLGAAATKILSDKKTREKIKDTVSDVSHRISVSVKRARRKARELRGAAERKARTGARSI